MRAKNSHTHKCSNRTACRWYVLRFCCMYLYCGVVRFGLEEIQNRTRVSGCRCCNGTVLLVLYPGFHYIDRFNSCGYSPGSASMGATSTG